MCSLYGLPDELTDEVVAHAVARATRGLSPGPDAADEPAVAGPEPPEQA